MMRSFPVILISVLLLHASCSTKIVSNNIYQQHKTTFDSIENMYEKLTTKRSFAIAFTDKNLTVASFELISDSLTRIYEIKTSEQRLADTLAVYKYDTAGIAVLIRKMHDAKVTWINNYDYWVNDLPQQMIYLSIKPITIRYPFSPPKYITLAYFRTPQVFDEKGRLLDSRRTKRIRKVNNQTFYKITDRICYTIAEKYR